MASKSKTEQSERIFQRETAKASRKAMKSKRPAVTTIEERIAETTKRKLQNLKKKNGGQI